MAINIPPRYDLIQQAVAYPEEEWTWRGIVNPGIWDPNWSAYTCLTATGTDGTYYLYDSNTTGMGTTTFNDTNNDLFFYSFKCDAVGNFIIQWGDAGNEQLTDVNSMIIHSEDHSKVDVAYWNNTSKRYEFINKDWSDDIIADYNAGSRELCFAMKILPSLFLHYSFKEILVGGT